MRKVLWWLIGGSPGGENRLKILRTLEDEPTNANRLSNRLGLDYKTVRHHLEVLEENGALTTLGRDYGETYFLSSRMEKNLDTLEEIAERAGLEA